MMHADNSANGESQEELERLLLEGFDSTDDTSTRSTQTPVKTDDEDEEEPDFGQSDVQGALGLFAEAAQDMATAGVELALGRHFACADYCNQAVEKAAQAVSLLRFGRRMSYNHDLRALGAAVGAPPNIQDEMDILTPFHPEMFYAETPPETADEVISAEQAQEYMQHARNVMRWARSIVLAV
ncbi:MAG TPA: HEPN domain-containing protein [Ktedonobacteraceae bacterium]|jgi:HEPN domain-containing protein|nr:HEPN domain-containing protein [Ktedonobacteraceae bacterium]